MTGHFEFDIEDIFQGASFHEVPHFALQYGVMVFQIHITHIKVNNGRKVAILNLIALNCLRVHRDMKFHILFYSNGLAI